MTLYTRKLNLIEDFLNLLDTINFAKISKNHLMNHSKYKHIQILNVENSVKLKFHSTIKIKTRFKNINL